MPPIIFTLGGIQRNKPPYKQGVAPTLHGVFLLPVNVYWISGVTRDSTGVALASCTVCLFRTLDNLLMDTVVSDGAGAYAFKAVGQGETYYVVAYKSGAPDVAGTTVNTLAGVV